jgi:four helix bundle protein
LITAARGGPSGSAPIVGAESEFPMLRVYEIVLQFVRRVAPVIEKIGERDPDLARQMPRSLASVPLNVAEGSHSRGKLRGLRYSNAAGSMRETLAGFETASAFGYVGALDEESVAMCRQIIGTLVRCMR